MDRRAAEEIIAILIRASNEINEAMHIYKGYTPADQTKPFTDAIGRMMFEVYWLIRPIVLEYPDLDPGGFTPDRREK